MCNYFKASSSKTTSRSFFYLDGDIQEEIFKNLTDDHIKSIITELKPDDRTELFEELPPDFKES
ncbi:hypothetical protein J7L87_01245, partial [bacterium]|nr:hypothetical protein [bacterium]